MELYKNMVYEWANVNGPNAVERLLWLSPTSPDIWTIKVYDPKAQPLSRTRSELESFDRRRPCGAKAGIDQRQWQPGHRSWDVFWCSADQTRCGVMGRSRCLIPRQASASSTELTADGNEPATPDSPAPFTPSGFVVQGTM